MDFARVAELNEVARLLTPNSYADVFAVSICLILGFLYSVRSYTWDKPDPHYHLWFERPQSKDGVVVGQRQDTQDISQKLVESNAQVAILWGSQSGTGERFANRLERELTLRFGVRALSLDISDYNASSISALKPSHIAVFILSTFGEGDPSDNAYGLWNWATRLGETGLENLRYVAFGLGNSNYKYYNRVVDVVSKALQNSGAELIMPVGRADDAVGATEEDFLAWKEDFFSMIQRTLGVQERPMVYEPTVKVIEDDSLEIQDLHLGEPSHAHAGAKAGSANSEIALLQLSEARELFNSKDRNCVHMDLDLSQYPKIAYKTGDHLAVWPMNPEKEVDQLIQNLGLGQRRRVPLLIHPVDKNTKVHVPSPTNLDSLLRHYLEICAPVSRETFKTLVQFAPSDAAKNVLERFSEKQAYAGLLECSHITLGRLLSLATATSESKTWPIPVEFLLETLPRLQPRYYSISSSSVISPRTPSITALVSNTPLARATDVSIPGLTTSFLHALSKPTSKASAYDIGGSSSLLNGTKILAHIRRSRFKLPITSSTPLILVAAGTGLAPFRAFIAERTRLRTMGKDVGHIILFFGCRHPDEDYIYQSEFADMKTTLGAKLEIVTAFSRVESVEKVYVQDRVWEKRDRVLELLEGGASLYICGRASMAREVGQKLGEGMKQRTGYGDEETREWSDGLKRRGKWQEDVWG